MELPEHPRLAEVASYLEAARAAAWVVDEGLRLVWMSEEAIWALRPEDDDEMMIGSHILEVLVSPRWMAMVPPEDAITLFMNTMPLILANPRTAETMDLSVLPEPFADLVGQIKPADHQPAMWSSTYDYVTETGRTTRLNWLANRLHDMDGTFIGASNVFTPGLRGRVMMMLSMGDESMHERMTRLTMPGRRSAAILFADIQDSGPLSRGLSSATYFALVRDLTSAVDGIVARYDGVVGKHAGDGMSSYFLTEEHGSDSAAARAALDAARAMTLEARVVAKTLVEDSAANIDPERIRLNIGVHWGGTLYMGQLVTGGRLEVTALGDEVNECARIQECARDGTLLASKALLERLNAADADALGIDPDAASYTAIASIKGASAKAKRDAGGLAVSAM
jgi:class 3 adenylate cyclase